MVMSEQDREFWFGYNEFADDAEFRVFQAWAYNGSCIQQRMGLFESPPAWWEILKPKIDRLKNYQQANIELRKPTDNFLSELKKLPPLQRRQQTFMEIAGYPHFENSCSNILQFYLNPNNEHGFGTLLLDSLATLINADLVTDEQSIEVRREELTARRNRLDLIVESNNYIIGIENKLFAKAYNPFCDYSRHLESSSKGRQIYKVLLSLRLEQPSPELCGFQPIGYDLFLQETSTKFDAYAQNANEQHTIFLQDFIQTMQNLQSPTSIDPQRLEYFRNNHQEITTLLGEVDELRKDMRRKIKQLEQTIDLKDISYSSSIESGLWKSSTDLIDVLWYIIQIENSLWLQLDVCLTPIGWKMQFWSRKGDRMKIKQHLQELNIDVEPYDKNSRLIYKGKDRAYNMDIESVTTWTIDMLRRLTNPIILPES